jgi:EpsI family protein
VSLLHNTQARVLTLVLVLQAVAFYAVAKRNELTPPIAPLADFPSAIGGWFRFAEYPMEKEVQDVLRADDTLTRGYASNERRAQATLFIAYFRSQRTGQSPHSPKNCLPGSGWEPSSTGVISVNIPESKRSITINRYVVSRGSEKSVVLYWYQSHGKVIASEFAGKFWLVLDAIRYRRSDTALVRVTVPVRGHSETDALQNATAFVQAIFPSIERHLPR